MSENTEMSDENKKQLDEYREQQRRRFEQAHSTTTTSASTPTSTSTSYTVKIPTKKTEDDEVEKRRSVELVRQMDEDEKLAKQLQDEENAEVERQRDSTSHQPTGTRSPIISYESDNESNSSASSMSDEDLARIMQAEEDANVEDAPVTISPRIRTSTSPILVSPTPPRPSSSTSSSTSSTSSTSATGQTSDTTTPQQPGLFTKLMEGAKSVYNSLADTLQQQAQQVQQQHQIQSDEELARQLQREEQGQNAPPTRQPIIQHPPPPSFFRPGGFPLRFSAEDEEDDDAELVPRYATPSNVPHPLAQLRALNSLFMSFPGMEEPENPLRGHLQTMMMMQSGMQGQPRVIFFNPGNLPTRRYRFPSEVIGADGAENLPPELRSMLQGERDTSYEDLLQLAERIQPVSKGASAEQIAELPSRTFHTGGIPSDQSSCGICLAEYADGEELTTLPACLHSFHKECIDKWLQINKICPVCRHEIDSSASS
eukprot:TRINITY_DN1327_c0_g1_i2.p1 TRINITY_DN1327_c0_g1~~TRINITY_DN1327_c0_g1_i2.p1  ORF type:complete len:501 (-),score=143.35 TRINITY_DN1327_c0_g1_i2:81-1532(-)